MNMIAEIDSFGIPEEQAAQRFSISNKDQAIWAMKKIAKAKAEQTENQTAAQAEIDRVNTWLNSENQSLQKETTFFESLLREYFLTLHEADPKLKTLKLPHGSLKIRAQQPEYTYDESQLLPWVKDNLQDAVVVKESVSKTVVKNYIKE